jgi:hypothetical protein
MSYLERQNRKAQNGLTPEQLRRRHPDIYSEPGELDRLTPVATLAIGPDGSREVLVQWGPPEGEEIGTPGPGESI